MKGLIAAAERRRTRPHINIALFGASGVGKTTMARTLDPETTLFVDLEAGTLAIEGWDGDVFPVRDFAASVGAHPWEICRALACFIGGPDPADATGPYSKASYDQLAGAFGDPKEMERFRTVFIDSITVASRWCLAWAQMQPEAFSEKTGKPDTRGAYGLLGREMMRWLTHLQHAPKSVIAVGILDRFEDDLKRVTFEPQIEGSKASRELAGIFDQVMTLDYLYDERGKHLLNESGDRIRAIYTKTGNAQGFPAKDRSGRLDPIEPPNLGGLLDKIASGKRHDSAVTTVIERPQTDQSESEASASPIGTVTPAPSDDESAGEGEDDEEGEQAADEG